MRIGFVVAGFIIVIIGLLLMSWLGLTRVKWSDSGGGYYGYTGEFYFPPLTSIGMVTFGFIVVVAGLVSPSPDKGVRQPVITLPSTSNETLAPQPTNDHTLTICPYCENSIPINSNFCPQCGGDLRHLSSNQNEGGRYKSEFYCESCGQLYWINEYRTSIPYCRECGAPNPTYVKTVFVRDS